MASSSSLESWARQAESLETAKNLLYFKQLVGLKFNKERLASLERQTKAHYSRYLQNHVQEGGGGRRPKGEGSGAEGEVPPQSGGGLFIMSVGAVGMAVTYRQLLKLYAARTTKVVSKEFKFGGAPVNWGSWRQFAASTDDASARKRIFDDFVVKSSALAPLIQSRFETYRGLLAKFGTDPLSVYLRHEGVSYGRLSSMVERLGELARGPFRDSLSQYSAEILGGLRNTTTTTTSSGTRSSRGTRRAPDEGDADPLRDQGDEEDGAGRLEDRRRRRGPEGEERLRVLLCHQGADGRPHLLQEGEPPRGLLHRYSTSSGTVSTSPRSTPAPASSTGTGWRTAWRRSSRSSSKG